MLTLYHKLPQLPIPTIANEDIPVYKIIRKNNKSMHQGYQYRPNTLYRLRKKLAPKDTLDDSVFRIETCGPTSYELEVIETKPIGSGYNSYFYKGFHSWGKLPPEIMNLKGAYKVTQFYIPKNARYYVGSTGDIISTSIRCKSLKKIKTELHNHL